MSRSEVRAVTPAALRRWPLPDPAACAGKEDRGRVLVVAGSASVPGAALLAATGALRAGAGKLQMLAPSACAAALAIAMPEARVDALRDGTWPRATARAVASADAVLVGPGMMPGAAMRRVVAQSLAHAQAASVLVLDAGALEPTLPGVLQRARHAATIVLTPHHGEMAKLLGCDIADVDADPEQIARRVARETGAVVALKGAETWIAAPDGSCWRNRHGSPGLGTSGSGDVLAGVVAGLAARGASALQAAVWGVHLHACAGAALAAHIGTVGFLAREIADRIPGGLPRG